MPSGFNYELLPQSSVPPPVKSREPILEMAAENLDLAAIAVGIGRGVSDTNPQTVGSCKRAFHRARRNGFHC